MARLSMSLLGGFQAMLDEVALRSFESDKARALLIYLAVEAGQPHRRERLAGLLWPDFTDQAARTNLRRVLSNVRQVIGDRDNDPPFLFVTPQSIQFNADRDYWLDVAEFVRGVAGKDGRSPAIHELEQAMALFNGPFLAGFSLPDSDPFEEWLRLTGESLQQQAATALHQLASHYESQGDYVAGLGHARRWLQLDPFAEAAHRQLMRLLALSGQRSEALAHYESCRQLLADELSLEPEAATHDLAERIRAGEWPTDAAGSVMRPAIRGYELRQQLGRGSYGSVYRAYQPIIGRDVAIKVILPQYANQPDFIRRFEVEAQLVARLEHPHIVPLYDYWREPDGAYLVMRWLRAGSLHDALRRGPWHLETAVRLINQIAAALAVAHQQGVVHRDIKPANILLDEENNAYLSDFGIALLLEPFTATSAGAAQAVGLPVDEGLTGTPEYISPEIVQGAAVTPQADIYSLGVVLYELLTGQHPFPDLPLAALLQHHLYHPLPLVQSQRPDLPPAVDDVIQTATAKDPNGRYPDALSLAKAFRQALQPGIVHARLATPIADVSVKNPYLGLRPFQEADAANFFGRDALIHTLIERLREDRFLVVVGPSGSGKSSVIKAGLIPALRDGALTGSANWFVTQMTPSTRPLEELETALLRVAANPPPNLLAQLQAGEQGLLRAVKHMLPDDNSELLLVIDQFEELFTQNTDDAARLFFLDSLRTAVTDPHSRLRIALTLRADFYDRPLQYAGFGQLVRAHQETVLPLTSAELVEAITGPAARAGLALEPGLATVMIADLHRQPGALPLLQFALTELVEQRTSRTLTLAGYANMGGIAAALSRRAESLFANLDKSQQSATRQLFLRLVAIGEDEVITRRRAPYAELLVLGLERDPTPYLMEQYGRYRLLTFDHDPITRSPTVELAHEALLREWERLRIWLEESRDDLYQHRRLQNLTQEWLAEGQDAGWLLTRTRLDQAAAWAAHTSLALSLEERAYLEASLAARQDRRLAEEARRQGELEAVQQLAEAERRRAEIQTEAAGRLRRRAIYLTAALVMAAVLAVTALLAGRQSALNAAEAQNNARIASTQEALAGRQAAAAMTAELSANQQRQIAENERDNAAAAAQAAANAQATAEAEAWQRATAEAVAVQERGAAETQARLASARELSLAALNSLNSDPELSVLLGMEAVNRTVTVDGLALPEAEAALRQALMNLRQEQTLPGTEPTGCPPGVWCSDVFYSQTGNLLAASGLGNTAVIWDAANGEQLLVVDGHSAPVIAIALSPDGRQLATAAADGTAMIWPVNLSESATRLTTPAHILTGHTAEVTDVLFSPDGALVATAGRDDAIKLWDAASGAEIVTLTGHEGSVRDIAFSPDGAELFSAASDNSARIWDVTSGAERLKLNGHSDRLTDLALSLDGSRLATASWDGTIKVWDTATGDELLSFPGDSGRVYAVAFSPDGRWLAGGGTDAVITVWEATTGEEQLRLPGHQGIIVNLAFAPDGRRLASGADDGTLRIWDVSPSGSREWLTLAGHNWVMFGVDFSPDGSRLATASWDGAVKLWDAQTGLVASEIARDEWRKFAVEFSPDGQQIVTSALNDTAVIWQLSTGEALHTFSGHGGPILDVSFSPDGHWLVTVGAGAEIPGLIQVWDAQNGWLERSWNGHDSSIERAAISPNGRLLATASTDGTVKLWFLASGELVATLPDHAAPVNAVNFSHDGRLLGTAGADNAARIWVLGGADIQLVHTLRGHSSVVWDVVFSPDATAVATIGFDGAVKLWDVAAGVERMTLPGAGNNGREVAFSPDGVYLAVTTGSGLVRLYVLPIDDLLVLAQSRVTRSLSDAECRQYLHLEQCEPDR